jgi:hypothetical protein
MKKTFLAVATFAVAISFNYCKNRTEKVHSVIADTLKNKNDTNYTFGFYVTPENNNVRYDLLLRIVKVDTGMVDLGDGLFKKGIVRDSLYGFPFVDTARDAKKSPMKDSTGKTMMQFQYMFVPKDKVWDLGIASDSVMKRFSGILNKAPAKDTTIRK